MKLLLDMNLSPAWVDLLQKNDLSAIHWSDVGDPRESDGVILQWCRNENAVLFTNDLDFGAILASAGLNGPNVIQFRTQDLSPGSLTPRLVRILKELEGVLLQGALVVIDDRSHRIRLLPIR